MEKIKTFADLQNRREALKSDLKLRELGDNMDHVLQVKVAMGTCGIAAGAKATMEAIINECQKQNLDVVVTQTGCMGNCNAEPRIEVIKPGQAPVVYDNMKADKVADFVAKNLK